MFYGFLSLSQSGKNHIRSVTVRGYFFNLAYLYKHLNSPCFMTLLYAFQGKKRALVASDLWIKFIPKEQLEIPKKEQKPVNLICEKFRRNFQGDRIGYAGALNSYENGVLENSELVDLVSTPLSTIPGFRQNRASIIYISVRDAQIYSGCTENPFVPTPRFSGTFAGTEIEHAYKLQEIANRLRSYSRNLDKDFLRELSKEVEAYFMRAEKGNETFGGFVSYLVTPGKFIQFGKNLGKLRGFKEAEIRNGVAYYED